LVRANTQSEWDSCDFALISCDDYWTKGMKKMLEAMESFNAPDNFLYFKFNENSIEFYQSKDDDEEILPKENEWSFVTLEEGEEESLERPESRLDQGSLILYKEGTGFYQTFGKHTNEEFYTAELPLGKLLASIEM
jgi:hypothetical protein